MLRKIAVIFVVIVLMVITIKLGMLTKKSAENYVDKAIERHDTINQLKRGE